MSTVTRRRSDFSIHPISGCAVRYVPDMPEVHQKVKEISQLPSTGDYGNVRYLAQQLLGETATMGCLRIVDGGDYDGDAECCG